MNLKVKYTAGLCNWGGL